MPSLFGPRLRSRQRIPSRFPSSGVRSPLLPWSRPIPLGLRLRLGLARHRPAVVAALLALAVATGLQTLRPPPAPTAQVLVAAHDLSAGHRLTARDLATRAWPLGAVPTGVVPRPIGRLLAAPLRRGEPVTDVRVTPNSPASLAGNHSPGGRLPPDWVAMTVRLSEPAAAILVAPGDRVKVLVGAATDPLSGAGASGGEAASARVVVDDALVLTTPSPATSAGGTTSGAASAGAAGSAAEGAGGLLGTLSDRRPITSGSGDDSGLPAGVLTLGLSTASAVDLAAASGVRFLTVVRQTQQAAPE